MKKQTRIIYSLIILVILPQFLAAQFENTDIGARASAMNGAFTSVSDNTYAVFYNPAGLGQMKFREISFFFNPSPFGLSELSTAALSYAEPTKIGVFGTAIKSYGFDLYRENNIIVSYANSYFPSRIIDTTEKDIGLYYGFNLNIYHLNIKNYNSAFSYGFDIGAMIKFSRMFKWGFIAKNITASKIGESSQQIAQIYRTGISYSPMENANLAFEVEKDVKFPLSFRFGFEYSPIKYLVMRAGTGNEPSVFSAGLGLLYGILRFDYAFTKTEDIGFSHQGNITVNLGGM